MTGRSDGRIPLVRCRRGERRGREGTAAGRDAPPRGGPVLAAVWAATNVRELHPADTRRGASAVPVGRPIPGGRDAGGEQGVREVLALLQGELDEAMALCGCRTIGEISSDLILR